MVHLLARELKLTDLIAFSNIQLCWFIYKDYMNLLINKVVDEILNVFFLKMRETESYNYN